MGNLELFKLQIVLVGQVGDVGGVCVVDLLVLALTFGVVLLLEGKHLLSMILLELINLLLEFFVVLHLDVDDVLLV